MNDFLNKYATSIGIVLVIGLIISGYFIISQPNDSNNNPPTPSSTLTVDIAGAVNSPGVYTFDQNSIIEDAIQKAGGISSLANTDLIAKTINRAALLQDHGKIYIPLLNISGDNQTVDTQAIEINQNLININSASLQLLDTLPGVGPITAERIIDYRTKKSQFNRPEDLMNVEGISTSKYEKLKDLITV